jgi:hypothetical protein
VIGRVIVWSFALGEYTMECSFLENPRGTFTVLVVENGHELQREVFVHNANDEDAWEKAWARAVTLRGKYESRALAAMRPIYRRLRSL